MSFPKPSHPNPQEMRAHWQNLNGEWDFSFDQPLYDRKITVPFSWSAPLSGIAEDRTGKAYYRRTVTWTDDSPRLFLIVGACDYSCVVTVNGQKVAEHLGGYSPIKAEVTRVWNRSGENTIEIEAEDTDDKSQTYGKQGYGNIRGIWQTVYLEGRGNSYIDSFVIRADLSGKVTVNAKIVGDFKELACTFDGQTYTSQSSSVEFTLSDPKLWSPETPYLYEGSLKLTGAVSCDEVFTYFGVREISSMKTAEGKRYVTLNGKPIFINSTLDQSFNPKGFFTLPSDEEEENEILRMKAVGLNSARIHIKTEEPLKLYYADKHGLMIIQDIPCFWGEPGESARKRFDQQMEECILRDINHPAIVHWVIYNETWGLFTGEGAGRKYLTETQAWVRSNWEKVKAMDPTRLVEDNSPCNWDHVVTDIDTWHFYANGYEEVKRVISDFCEKSTIGSTFNFTEGNCLGDVPLMNSECGNVWGIDGNAGDSDYSWHYKYMINEFRLHDVLCGFVFTEFHDVVNEFNGYYRIDNSQKTTGYDGYVPGMSLQDLHEQDFLCYDAAPMTSVKPGEKISLPLYVSSFSDKKWGETLYAKVTLVFTGENGAKKQISTQRYPVVLSHYGLQKVCDAEFTAPVMNGTMVARLTLESAEGWVYMRNFVCYDILSAEKGILLPLESGIMNGEGFLCQNGEKLNLLEDASVTFRLPTGCFRGKKVTLVMEASARERFTKDGQVQQIAADVSYMLGYKVDRGANPNCFFMTTPGKEEISLMTLKVNGKVAAELTLPDDPADSRGALSWHYQQNPRLLDEAGTYGWLCRLTLPEDCADGTEMELTLSGSNGLSLFGRKSGRYPTGLRLIVE